MNRRRVVRGFIIGELCVRYTRTPHLHACEADGTRGHVITLTAKQPRAQITIHVSVVCLTVLDRRHSVLWIDAKWPVANRPLRVLRVRQGMVRSRQSVCQRNHLVGHTNDLEVLQAT